MQRVYSYTSNHGSIEGEGSFPSSFFDAMDALNTLRDFCEDLTIHCCSCIRLPVQNPRERERDVNEIMNPNSYMELGFSLLPFDGHCVHGRLVGGEMNDHTSEGNVGE